MSLTRINWERDINKILKGEIITNKSHSLRRWILKKEYLKYKCNICSISSWNNKKIILDLDHIDGDRSNNKIENLRFLCPNCHSQTPTFRGKNINNKQLSLRQYTPDIISMYTQGDNISSILTVLGFSGGKNYKLVKDILNENNINLKHNPKIQELIDRTKNLNLDFSKKTWGVTLSKELNLSPQYCLNFVKKYIPQVLEVKKVTKPNREKIIKNRISLFQKSNLDVNDENFYIELGNLYGISKWASQRFYKKYLKTKK